MAEAQQLSEVKMLNDAATALAEVHTEAPSEAAPPKLGQLARDYLVKANNNPADAIEMLHKRLIGDQKVLREVVSEAIEMATNSAVRAQVRTSRDSIWNRAQPTANTSAADLARGIAGALMDYPLPGGPKLRDATREQVNDASKTYLTNAATMSARGKWLAMIAMKLRPGEVVGKKLSEEQLAAMQDKVKSP